MHRINKYILWYGGGLLLLAIAIIPLIHPSRYERPFFHSSTAIACIRLCLLALPALAAFGMFRSYAGSRREKFVLALLAITAACFCEQILHQFVDKGHYFGGADNNTTWQRGLQKSVIALDPAVIPHSYRFLSHSIVAIFERLGNSFELARGVYRVLFNTLLFAAAIRYARLYLGRLAAIGVLLVLVMIFPITVAWFAGQFVDPISHLSFVACLYFYARNYEPGIGPTIVLGVFAKESVAALAVCRAFYGPQSQRCRAGLRAICYLLAALISLAAIRYFVNHGSFAYRSVSGVGLNQTMANLRGYREWSLQYIFSIGILLPGACLGWKLMDRSFRLTCLVLTLSLIVSSALFSWLNEVRNLVPALVMLAIVNFKYIESRFGFSMDGDPIPTDRRTLK